MAEEKRVLIIDDDPVVQQVLAKLIRRAGAEAVTVGNVTEATAAIKEGADFDLIFLDLIMPSHSGWELLDRIECDLSERNAPIIVITGAALSEDETRKLQRRTRGMISKNTFDLVATEALIAEILKEHL